MRFGIAFTFCIVVGVAAGLLMGMSLTARSLLDPPIEITRPIPKLALLPLFVTWFGYGELSKVLLIASSVAVVTLLGAHHGVRTVPRAYIDAATSLGAGRSLLFRRVVLPFALPHIFGIDFSVTKHVFMLWLVAAFLFIVVTMAVRRYLKQDRLIPSGFMNPV